jgi:hypothetical protein
MHVTIDLHLNEDDVSVEPNETHTGLTVRPIGSFAPILNLFTGTSPAERQATRRMLITALDQLAREANDG